MFRYLFMKTMIAIMAIVAGSASYAQTEEEEKERKHLIGVDVAPVVNLITGGEKYNFNTTLQYQYKLTPKLTLRTSLNYNRYEKSPSFLQSSNGVITETKQDTIWGYISTYSWERADIRIGAHYKMGNKKIDYFIGLETVIGMDLVDDIRYNYVLIRDSANNNYLHSHVNDLFVNNFHYTNQALTVGINALAGLHWNFHPRWSIGTQFNFISTYFHGLKTNKTEYTEYGVAHSQEDFNLSYFRFDARPLQILLNYKF